jgi:hypothetical protein
VALGRPRDDVAARVDHGDCERRYEAILVFDDAETRYFCAETSADYSHGSRGASWFTPGPPAHAESLRVETRHRSYDVPL